MLSPHTRQNHKRDVNVPTTLIFKLQITLCCSCCCFVSITRQQMVTVKNLKVKIWTKTEIEMASFIHFLT